MNTLLNSVPGSVVPAGRLLTGRKFFRCSRAGVSWREAVAEAVAQRSGRKMPHSETKVGEDDGINKESDYYGKVFDQMLNLWQTNDKIRATYAG